MKYLVLIVFFLMVIMCLRAQVIFPDNIERQHPRLISGDVNKSNLIQQIETNPEVSTAYESYKERVDNYVNQHVTDPEWMVSRLQMYWKTHSTDVFIKGAFYSHAEGHAPVPTVRFTGARDPASTYFTPRLEDVKPYMDDERGLWLQNKETQNWEWAEQSKTSRVVESLNSQIMGLASTAALVYWLEGDEKYAKFAFDIFDTYMVGMSYRKEPYDLNRSHNQTLVGLTSFQVIKEGIVNPLTSCYDYLYEYLQQSVPEKMPLYADTFRKFADIIIKNGVPFNNWNLYQADYIARIAVILEDNSQYENGLGCQYYLDRIFNYTVTRQWSILELLERGYDENTGIWNECPAYSSGVSSNFIGLASFLHNTIDIDLLPYMPVIPKAIKVLPQYMFPNRYMVCFGDGHYTNLRTGAMMAMVANAQNFNRPDQEKEFTAMVKMLNETPSGGTRQGGGRSRRGNAFQALLSGNETKLDENIPAGEISDYMTQTFYAPNVSWLVQRNGLDPKHGLMVSQAASLGNHMHSNGIAIELYGKGYVLAPEGGRGSSYFQPDYLEYYSQFPAHNTVVVDGISKYPEMKSNHAFIVSAMYPESERKEGYYPGISFSDLYFLEPETNADQNRVMSIIRTGETSGYYIDIFRSRRKNSLDKYHDYFYHNIGQLSLTNASNQALNLSPSERLTFADGDLFAYDYIWDKQSVKTDQDFIATFDLNMEGEEMISMKMWMKGYEDREVFSVMTPPSDAFGGGMVPREITQAPLPAVVVRQSGEAWTHPFAAVFEPCSESEPATINSIQTFDGKGASEAFVGLKIESLSGRTDYIFSSDISEPSTYQEITFAGTYGVVTTGDNTTTLFLGSGTQLAKGDLRIEMIGKEAGSAVYASINDTLFLTADSPVTVVVPDHLAKGKPILTLGAKKLYGKRIIEGNNKMIVFQVPVTSWQQLNIKIEN